PAPSGLKPSPAGNSGLERSHCSSLTPGRGRTASMARTSKYLAQGNKLPKTRPRYKTPRSAPGNAAQFRAQANLANGQHCRLLHDRVIMRVKFEATDATGKVHKRSSMNHVYSYCVVIHFAAYPPSNRWPAGIPACSHAEWVGSCALAARKASRWRKEPHLETIEILEATQL